MSELLGKAQERISCLSTRSRMYFGGLTANVSGASYPRQNLSADHLSRLLRDGYDRANIKASLILHPTHGAVEIGRAIRGGTPALLACRRSLASPPCGEWKA